MTVSQTNVIGLLILIMENLMGGYCFYRLAKPFLENRKKAPCIGMVYFLVLMVLFAVPLELDSFLAYGIGSLAGFLVMCLLERRNYRQKAFLAVAFFSLRWFTLGMAEILYDGLYAHVETTEYMQEHPEWWMALYALVCVFYLALELALMASAIFSILKSYSYKNDEMSGKELLLLSAPSLMGVIGFRVIRYYRTFFIMETGKLSDAYDMLSLLYYAVTVAAVVAVIVLYQSIKAGQEEKRQNDLLAVQIENTERHIEQVESLYQDIRRIKHDMANHILTLEGLYARNREEAEAYGEELKKALSEAAGKINSGNPVTDVILQEMQNQAEQRQIDFQADFHYPADSHVNAFDISVILNNALQNALEYADKDGHAMVSVLSYRRNNAYMIEVSNSFTGSLKWDAESGLPMTSKEPARKGGDGKGDGGRQMHGYGLSNIRRVALKYAGDIAVDVKEGRFCLSVLLMMEP